MFQVGVMLTALETGVLKLLAGGPKDLASLARESGCSERGLRNLLQALVPLG